MLNKKLLAVAIVGSLFAGNALAVDLVTQNTSIPTAQRLTNNPLIFAEEIRIGANGALLQTSLVNTAGKSGQIAWQIGHSFSDGEVRYVRLKATDGFKFGQGTTPIINRTVVLSTGGVDTTTVAQAPANVLGAVNGYDTDRLYLSVTSTSFGPAAPAFLDDQEVSVAVNGGAAVAIGGPGRTAAQIQAAYEAAAIGQVRATDVISFNANHTIANVQSVALEASLYDQPSQAANGGDTGKLTNATSVGTYLTFAPSYTFTAIAEKATASVDADPIFTAFVPAGATTATTARLATNLAFGLNDPDGATGAQNSPFGVNGAQVALGDVFAVANAAFTTGTRVTVSGDFAAAANADGTYTGDALARVTWGGAAANALSATTATFTVGNPVAAKTGNLVLQRRDGNVIPASVYTATLVAANAATHAYAPTSKTTAAGEVVRDGTELQAPLVQVPTGWLTRLVLTNTGTLPRNYSISTQSANVDGGDTVANFDLAGALKTGSIPAGGTKVILLNGESLSEAGNRGTVIVNVTGPNSQIQGLYQIVNPNSGSISNHVLVRPGTN